MKLYAWYQITFNYEDSLIITEWLYAESFELAIKHAKFVTEDSIPTNNRIIATEIVETKFQF